MKCYDWEQGIFYFNKVDYKSFTKLFQIRINDCSKHMLNHANYIYKKWSDYDLISRKSVLKSRDPMVKDALLFINQYGEAELKKPSSKDFIFIDDHNNFILTFSRAIIRADKDTHTILWKVAEGEDAVEKACAHVYGKIFMNMLDTFDFTDDSHGYIIGYDNIQRKYFGHNKFDIIREFGNRE